MESIMRKLLLQGSVGKGGKNVANDVKLVRALLNVYLRTQSKTVLSITGKSDAVLEQTIHDFQSSVLKTPKPDSRVDPRGKTVNTLKDTLRKVFQPISFKRPTYGIVTWDSEGTEGGFYHSRKLHVPSNYSGLTIGRGYDCSQKTQGKIATDLTTAGLATAKVAILKKAAGLPGIRAERFIIDNDLLDYQITHPMQQALFKISYLHEESVVKRVSKQTGNIKAFGKVDWKTINPYIKDIIIDLKYRGDYDHRSRNFIQKPFANNDLATFKKLIQDKTKWPNVPLDRFKRRSDYIAKAPAQIKKTVKPTP